MSTQPTDDLVPSCRQTGSRLTLSWYVGCKCIPLSFSIVGKYLEAISMETVCLSTQPRSLANINGLMQAGSQSTVPSRAASACAHSGCGLISRSTWRSSMSPSLPSSREKLKSSRPRSRTRGLDGRGWSRPGKTWGSRQGREEELSTASTSASIVRWDLSQRRGREIISGGVRRRIK